MMELTSRLLRPRFCIRYLHILLTFSVFTVFLVFFHQIRIKGPEFMSDVSIFARNANANVRRGEDTTGVLPIVFSHTHSTKKEKCTGDSLMLEGIVPELPVGRARYDNRRLVCTFLFSRLMQFFCFYCASLCRFVVILCSRACAYAYIITHINMKWKLFQKIILKRVNLFIIVARNYHFSM